VDEEDLVEALDDDLDVVEGDTEVEVLNEDDVEDIEDVMESDDIGGEYADNTDDIELVDEEDLVEAPDDDLDVVEGDTEVEVLDEDDVEDIEDVMESDDIGGEYADDTDDIELVEEDDLAEASGDALDEVEENIGVGEHDEESAEESEEGKGLTGDEIGLPIDQLMEDDLDFEEFQLDQKQKRLLAEQFDGYLGAMERYYNQYIIIKKGSYKVGVDKPDIDVMAPQQVLLSAFYMGKYPVTNALFEVFIERTGYKTTAEKLGYGYVYHGRFRKVTDPNTGFTSSKWNATSTREKVTGANWYQPSGPGSTLHKKRNHPVVQVSLRDARTFAAWAGKRLPTEIEWEAAARTRSGFNLPWGDEWIEGFCNLESSGISDTCPVDQFPHGANETGLADLLGNVMEWTSDECEPKFPLETPSRFFIAKGGSWISHEQTQLYDRKRIGADSTSNILGFRCLAD
jgi:formylglycine-generating enzyme required for sulfatase activity